MLIHYSTKKHPIKRCSCQIIILHRADRGHAKPTRHHAYQGYIDTVLVELEEQHGINPYTTPVLVYTNMDRSKQQALDDIFNGKTFKWIDEHVQSCVAVVDVDTGKLVAVGAGRNKTSALSYNFAVSRFGMKVIKNQMAKDGIAQY